MSLGLGRFRGVRSADHRRVHDSGGSNGGFHPRTLPPCFGYSHLARLSRYAHAAWTPWDRARPSIREEMRTCIAGRYAQTNRRVHQRPPAVLVRRKHEEIYPHPNNALEKQLESRLFGEPSQTVETTRWLPATGWAQWTRSE